MFSEAAEIVPICVTWQYTWSIGAGTGGEGEQLLPNKIIGGATSTSSSAIFSVTYRV